MPQTGLFEDEHHELAASNTPPQTTEPDSVTAQKKMVTKAATQRARILLVDGHALAYRSYFALADAGLRTATGETTQAVYGFLKTLAKLLRGGKNRAAPQAVIVVFDPPTRTFRHDQFDGYKATRAKMPEDLPQQIERIKSLVDALGLMRFEIAGYEADDVIGTLAKRAEAEDFEVRILTSDRDAYQLLSEHVKVINADAVEVGPSEVSAKYGVTVEQWVDYRALTGDASDNIPGAKGIGPKTAAGLLNEYGSLEAILAKANEIKPARIGNLIRSSVEDIICSRELSRMVTTLELEIDFKKSCEHRPDTERLRDQLSELEFGSFLQEFSLEQRAQFTVLPWTTPSEGAVFGFVLTADDAVSADLAALAYSDDAGVRSTETTNAQTFSAQTFSAQTLSAQTLSVQTIHAANAKALSTWGISRGLDLKPGDDPLLMAYVIDSNLTDAGKVAMRFFNEGWPKDAAGQAELTNRLLKRIREEFNPGLWAIYETIERPVSHVLSLMEARGIEIDVDYFRTLAQTMGERMSSLESELHSLAGETFNVNSRDQLERVLYDKLGLASGRKTNTGKRSTAVSALEPLREEHPIIDRLLEYREMAKLKGTYLDPLPNLVNARTGRLHTTFQQTIASTGRLSSINPNLQNIPIRTSIGREIRKGFVASEGYTLLAADYSQIELRILAHISAERELIEGFSRGEDIHCRTAATIFNIPLEAVTTAQRRAAKTINFGVLYGMSAHRLARDTGLPYAEANEFIQKYFAAYPGISRYIEETKAFCHKHGFVSTLLGRRRYLPEINAKAFVVREAAERAAINAPIQGTNADIIKLAMIQLEPELSALGARLLLQVHDELIVEVPENQLDETTQLVRQIMEQAYALNVPLGVEIGVGHSWFEAK